MTPRIAQSLGMLLLAATANLGAQSYNAPESAEFHPRLDRHLIGNRSGGNILARAPDGSLSVFTADPTSPYGVELLAGTLFVLDSGQLKGYDVDSALPVLSLPIPAASFLNGITSNGVDTIYISDYTARKIYSVNVADLSAPAIGPTTNVTPQPNGLVFDRANNRLLIATWGSNAKVQSLDLSVPGSVPADLIYTTLTNLDGIALDCNGAIVVSAWSVCGTSGSPTGCLRRFDPPFTLTSTPQVLANNLASPADIDYNVATGQIAVPETGANRLTLVDTTCEAALFRNDFER